MLRREMIPAATPPGERHPAQNQQSRQPQADNRPAPVPPAQKHQAGQQMERKREQRFQQKLHVHHVPFLLFFSIPYPGRAAGKCNK